MARVRSPLAGVLALGLGIVFAWALVGIPLIALGVGQLLAWAHRDPPAPDGATRAHRAGWVATIVLSAAVIVGVLFGLATIELFEDACASDDSGLLATAMLAPLAAGVVFAPLAMGPSLALRGAKSAWLVESVWLSSHRGALRTMLVGAGLGAHGALPFFLAWAIPELVGADLAPLGLLAGGALTIVLAPISFVLLARGFEDARARAAQGARADRAIGALGRLALGPLLVLAFVVALVAITPSPLPSRPISEPFVPDGAPLRIEGTDFSVRSEWNRVHVTHDDGREDMYPVSGWIYRASARAERVRYRDRDAWRVELRERSFVHAIVLDDHGERLDDPIAARIDARLDAGVTTLLALASALGVLFAIGVGRSLARVRAVAALLAPDRARVAHEVTTGTLALSGRTVRIDAGKLVGAAGATIESDGGAIRIALPDSPVDVLACDPAVSRPREGTPVTLISNGAKLAGIGLREAATPFPAGGALVIGDPARALAALVRSSFPLLVRLWIATGALVIGAALAFAVGA